MSQYNQYLRNQPAEQYDRAQKVRLLINANVDTIRAAQKAIATYALQNVSPLTRLYLLEESSGSVTTALSHNCDEINRDILTGVYSSLNIDPKLPTGNESYDGTFRDERGIRHQAKETITYALPDGGKIEEIYEQYDTPEMNGAPVESFTATFTLPIASRDDAN